MFLGSSIVKILETGDHHFQQMRIDAIAAEFLRMCTRNENESYTEFIFNKDGGLRVSDLTGYTMLMRLCQSNRIQISDYVKIEAADHSVICSTLTNIPLYSIDNPINGFHGEVMYPYIITSPLEILDPSFDMSIFKYVRTTDRNNMLVPVNITHIRSSALDEEDNICAIYTKSRFFDVGGIQFVNPLTAQTPIKGYK